MNLGCIRPHNLRSIAGLLLAASVAVGAGCAKQDWIDRTLVTENVAGSWSGTVGGRAVVRLDLQHEGPKVSGLMKWAGVAAPEPVEGSVSGDVFTFRNSRGTVSGELTVSGDDMTGQVFGWPLGGTNTRTISFHREAAPTSGNPAPR